MTQKHAEPRIALAAERRAEILDILRRERRVVATELVQRLGVSRDTVRRDLDELAAAGLLQRVHGGGLPPVGNAIEYSARLGLNVEEKRELATGAVRLLRERQVIVLGPGTSVQHLVEQFPDLEATVFVTSPTAATELVKLPRLHIRMVGGTLDREGLYTYGDDAVQTLANINADIAFIGAFSIDAGAGLTVPRMHGVASFRAIIDSAAHVVALATGDKLGTVSPYRVAPIDELTHLIVSRTVPEAVVDPYRAAGLDVIRGG